MPCTFPVPSYGFNFLVISTTCYSNLHIKKWLQQQSCQFQLIPEYDCVMQKKKKIVLKPILFILIRRKVQVSASYTISLTVLHNKKYTGMERRGKKKRKMGNLPGTHESKRSRKGFNYQKRGSSCYMNSETMQDHAVQDSGGWEGLPPARLKKHTPRRKTSKRHHFNSPTFQLHE